MDANLYIQAFEKRQGLLVACLEDVAYRMGYINDNQLTRLTEPLLKKIMESAPSSLGILPIFFA